jgi:octaprenyl-diphosphate synthase
VPENATTANATVINPQNTISLDGLRQPIAADMQAVDGVIRNRLHSEVALVNQVAQYIIAAGGKRLRPALVIMTAQAVGIDKQHPKLSAVHEMAAAIEFIHTATLLHDDVVDESDLRRGRKTANAAFGNAASVLVGDFLYSRAFQMMVDADSMPIMQVMANATNIIAEGEVLQLMNVGDPDTTEAAYLQVIEYKTAKLFEAACEVGAILGEVDAATRVALATYGRQLGVAFQIMDDVLDYEGASDVLGKAVGDDFREGKVTLPLILAMQGSDAALAQLVRNAIENQGADFSAADLNATIAALHASGILSAARARAVAASQQAVRAIEVLPKSAATQNLIDLAVFASDRAF